MFECVIVCECICLCVCACMYMLPCVADIDATFAAASDARCDVKPFDFSRRKHIRFCSILIRFQCVHKNLRGAEKKRETGVCFDIWQIDRDEIY